MGSPRQIKEFLCLVYTIIKLFGTFVLLEGKGGVLNAITISGYDVIGYQGGWGLHKNICFLVKVKTHLASYYLSSLSDPVLI